MKQIPWWNTALGEAEIDAVARAIRNRCVSQGRVTEEFEGRLAALLGVPHVVCATSGTAALMLAYLAAGIGPGSEVVVPNRTFIATAHAAALLGATVRLVDVGFPRPVIDVSRIEAAITPATRAIVPVHINGMAADVDAVARIAARHGLTLIEDAAQGFMSRFKGRLCGVLSRFGCFSLSMGKLLTTGQGGFVVCHDPADDTLLRRIRSHGVLQVKRDVNYDILGGNFKFTDILAAVGLAQLDRIEARMERQRAIHRAYRDGLAGLRGIRLLEVDLEAGELPVQAEALCSERDRLVAELAALGVEAVCQVPDLSRSPHLRNPQPFAVSPRYSDAIVILPCGPDQPLENVQAAIAAVRSLDARFRPLQWQEG